jgi:hypothetical protein
MLIRNISVLGLRNLRRSLGPVVPGPVYQSLPLILRLKKTRVGKVGIRLTDPIELNNTAFEGFISAARR